MSEIEQTLREARDYIADEYWAFRDDTGLRAKLLDKIDAALAAPAPKDGGQSNG